MHAWHQMEPLFSSGVFNHKPNQAYNPLWKNAKSLSTTAWLSFWFFALAAFFWKLQVQSYFTGFFPPVQHPPPPAQILLNLLNYTYMKPP